MPLSLYSFLKNMVSSWCLLPKKVEINYDKKLDSMSIIHLLILQIFINTYYVSDVMLLTR